MSSALEDEIANIWKEVLGVSDVASGDDFFELGGTSLHAARAVTKTRAAFGLKLSPESLFDHPTFGGFTAQVAAAQVSEAPA